MFSVVSAILLVATAANAASIQQAQVTPNGRIYGGDDALIETFPYQISLQYGSRHMCGGSIIDNQWIVTAGHCILGPAQSMYVRAGTTYVGDGGTVHRVAKVIRHSKYRTDARGVPFNDIALIKLADPIVYDDQHEAIELYNQYEKSKVGDYGVITGWGVTEDGMPFQLQSVAVPMMETSECQAAYAGFGGLPYNQICAAYYGVGGKDACQGDSGGPLAIENRLAGIVSWGNGCALPDFPGAYTEIAAYRDWISETMARN